MRNECNELTGWRSVGLFLFTHLAGFGLLLRWLLWTSLWRLRGFLVGWLGLRGRCGLKQAGFLENSSAFLFEFSFLQLCLPLVEAVGKLFATLLALGSMFAPEELLISAEELGKILGNVRNATSCVNDSQEVGFLVSRETPI